jgi:hypothetical protein
MADEAAARDRHMTEMDRNSAALGVPPVRTMGDLLTFMVAAGVLIRSESDSVKTLRLNPSVPLPDEVLPLTAEERAREDEFRWGELHEPTAQEIIPLFDPDGSQHDRLVTSLERLARQLDVPVESARARLLALIKSDDFTERASVHQVFEIRVD